MACFSRSQKVVEHSQAKDPPIIDELTISFPVRPDHALCQTFHKCDSY